MVRDTAPLTADVQVGTSTPDPETTLEALIRGHNRMPLDTDLTAGDLLQWDGSGLVAGVAVSELVVWVNHGPTAGTARPTVGGLAPGLVIWVGTVEPTNALATDIWVNTS